MNEQTIKTNTQNLTDTDNCMVVTRGQGAGGISKGGQIYGDGRLDFGW